MTNIASNERAKNASINDLNKTTIKSNILNSTYILQEPKSHLK